MDSKGLSPDKRERHDENIDEFDEALDDWFAWCDWYESKDWNRIECFAASRLAHVAIASLGLVSVVFLWRAFCTYYTNGVAICLSIVFVGADVIGPHLAGSVMIPKFGVSPRSRASFNRHLLGATSLAATGAVVLAAIDLLTALSQTDVSPGAFAERLWFTAPSIYGLALVLIAAFVFLLALAKAELRESHAEELEEIGFFDGEPPNDDAKWEFTDDDSELPF